MLKSVNPQPGAGSSVVVSCVSWARPRTNARCVYMRPRMCGVHPGCVCLHRVSFAYGMVHVKQVRRCALPRALPACDP